MKGGIVRFSCNFFPFQNPLDKLTVKEYSYMNSKTELAKLELFTDHCPNRTISSINYLRNSNHILISIYLLNSTFDSLVLLAINSPRETIPAASPALVQVVLVSALSSSLVVFT